MNLKPLAWSSKRDQAAPSRCGVSVWGWWKWVSGPSRGWLQSFCNKRIMGRRTLQKFIQGYVLSAPFFWACPGIAAEVKIVTYDRQQLLTSCGLRLGHLQQVYSSFTTSKHEPTHTKHNPLYLVKAFFCPYLLKCLLHILNELVTAVFILFWVICFIICPPVISIVSITCKAGRCYPMTKHMVWLSQQEQHSSLLTLCRATDFPQNQSNTRTEIQLPVALHLPVH